MRVLLLALLLAAGCRSRAGSLEVVSSHCDGEESRSCYDGPRGTEGVGACSAGIQVCAGGTWSPCQGEQLPAPEGAACDGIDQDCNGIIDDGTTGPCAPCAESTSRACYTGPSGTVHTGPCAPGMQLCSGGKWGPCEGQTLPSDEEPTCDGIDQDCDGQADEGVQNACGSCSVDCSTRTLDLTCPPACYQLPKQLVCDPTCLGLQPSSDGGTPALKLVAEESGLQPPALLILPDLQMVAALDLKTGLAAEVWTFEATPRAVGTSLVLTGNGDPPYDAFDLQVGLPANACQGRFDDTGGWLLAGAEGLELAEPCSTVTVPANADPPPVPVRIEFDEFVLTAGDPPSLIDVRSGARAQVALPAGRPFVDSPYAYFPGDPVVRVGPAIGPGLALDATPLSFAADEVAVVDGVAWSLRGSNLQRTVLADETTETMPLPDDLGTGPHVLPASTTIAWVVGGTVVESWDGSGWSRSNDLVAPATKVDTGLERFQSTMGTVFFLVDTGSDAGRLDRLEWHLTGDGLVRAYVDSCGPLSSGSLGPCASMSRRQWNIAILVSQTGPRTPALSGITATIER